MAHFPKLKKRINDFLIDEEGEIDKDILLKTGIISSTTLLSLVLSSESAGASWLHSSSSHSSAPPVHHSHSNSLSINCDAKMACSGQHDHSVS
ncbi:MAG: hypothetical protein Q8O89_07940 [Nanoarchaeota archaeon]|nr:hypothetical protein [Nanoarchaeota archaeon]